MKMSPRALLLHPSSDLEERFARVNVCVCACVCVRALLLTSELYGPVIMSFRSGLPPSCLQYNYMHKIFRLNTTIYLSRKSAVR